MMRKLSLSEWSSISEIVGAVAVVISLLFVTFSINKNTAMLETNAEREFLDAWRTTVQMPFYTNERLAEIQLKVHTGEQLAPVEAKMWENFLRALFDTWFEYYGAYKRGQVSDQSWEAMNAQILTLWERERMGEFWAEMGFRWGGTGFGEHINKEVVRMSNGDTPD
jgi:hypothetical protein